MDVSFLGGPRPQRGVGIVAPFDFALDRELWRWVPDDVSLHLTRTPFVPVEVSLDLARLVSEHETLREGVQALCAVAPEVVAYACTSGSFVGGTAGERAMGAAMTQTGEIPSVTTSGALLEALREIDARRIAVVTPYTKSVTDALEEYLGEAGIGVTGRSYLGLTREIWRVPYRDVVDMARNAVVDAPDALFISCTNLPTYDVIPQLEAELRMPVLSANQVTMWAALRCIDKEAVGPYQALLDPVARRGPAAMTQSPPEPRAVSEPGPEGPADAAVLGADGTEGASAADGGDGEAGVPGAVDRVDRIDRIREFNRLDDLEEIQHFEYIEQLAEAAEQPGAEPEAAMAGAGAEPSEPLDDTGPAGHLGAPDDWHGYGYGSGGRPPA